MKSFLASLSIAIIVAIGTNFKSPVYTVADTDELKGLKQELIDQGYRMPADVMDLPFTIFTKVLNKEACIELGGLLYGETKLSAFGQTSCAASCHLTDNHLSPRSAQIGAGGYFGNGGRLLLKYFPKDLIVDAPAINAPSGENVIYTKRVLHDCSQTSITQISQNVGSNAHNIDWTAIVGDPVYEHYFNVVFGSPEITEIKFQQAILMFQESYISNQTPFQKWLRNEIELTRKQQKYVNIFFKEYKCQSCHSGAGLNGEGLKMSHPVKPHDFFNTELVNTRSVYNMDAFDTYGWGGDYHRLGNFNNRHFDVLSSDGKLKPVPKKDAKLLTKAVRNLFCD